MSGPVEEASPPKSGWSERVAPMKPMYPALPASTGALDTSRFPVVRGEQREGPGKRTVGDGAARLGEQDGAGEEKQEK